MSGCERSSNSLIPSVSEPRREEKTMGDDTEEDEPTSKAPDGGTLDRDRVLSLSGRVKLFH